jgi:hypothetical protein
MLQALTRNVRRQRVSLPESIPAPTGGWDAVSALANMPKDRAVRLTNWFPEPNDVKIRKGYKTHATGMGSGAVQSLLTYHGLTSSGNRLFAAANSTIYDVSAEATATATTVTGLSNNKWQWVNYTTSSGNHYLWACNGADTPKLYDGSTWTTPSITGITSTSIIHVNVHKQRLWFILANSMDAAYLPTDSIAGAAVKFPLGNVMKKGGFLLAMGTWTNDGGLGPDDYAAFVSSQGQVAVYQGTNPADSTAWSLVGVYDIAPAIGNRCLTKVGADLAIITIEGVVPMSKALGYDQGSVSNIAITLNINNAMHDAARSYRGNFGWELIGYPKGTMAILNVPVQEGSSQVQYVMNTITGAWCDFSGWNANCFAVFAESLYFGGNAGTVYHADFGAKDGSTAITATGQGAYNYYGKRGILKQWKMIRALLSTSSNSNRLALGVSTDFKDNASLGTPTAATVSGALYDTAIYDTDVYVADSQSVTDWTTLAGIGQAGSIHFRGLTNAAGDLDVRLNGFDVLLEPGEFL